MSSQINSIRKTQSPSSLEIDTNRPAANMERRISSLAEETLSTLHLPSSQQPNLVAATPPSATQNPATEQLLGTVPANVPTQPILKRTPSTASTVIVSPYTTQDSQLSDDTIVRTDAFSQLSPFQTAYRR